jgi:hypothetical protein
MLATLELPARRFQAELGTGRTAGVVDMGVNDVRVTVMPTTSSRAERSPNLGDKGPLLFTADVWRI